MASVPQTPICGIYKITNLVNGMVYIGQSRNVEWRFYQHRNNHRDTHNDYLRKAIKKYGVDNFSFEVIETCTVDQLDGLERKYIAQFNSLVPNGYNLESGGWSFKNLPEETKRKIGDALSRPVNQYTVSGEYLRTFSSAQDVARMTGRTGDRSNIQMVCLGKKKTALGFQWRYADESDTDSISPVKGYRREKGARVSQYSKDGKYLATYPSRFEASKATGVKAKNIFCCMSGASKSAGGFVWRYEEPIL